MSSNYISTADRAKTIRKAIKDQFGYTGAQVSVRTSNYSMGSSIRITIKDRSACQYRAQIEAIGNEQESVRRCEVSGDILSGGNRYVTTEIDWELERDVAAELRPRIESAHAAVLARHEAGKGNTGRILGQAFFIDSRSNRINVEFQEEWGSRHHECYDLNEMVRWVSRQALLNGKA